MRITKVRIQNFKIFKEQEFDFGDSKMVLITGANGLGKTTLIDAIEWCLTGNIARVKKSYEQRNTTQAEKGRDENKRGIIKNYSCNVNDKVKVTVYIEIEDAIIQVYREQLHDDLYARTSLCFDGDVPDEIKAKLIENFAEDKFYSYHVCDTYKSFDFLSTKRQRLKEQFEDFLRTHPRADAYTTTLNRFREKIEVEINVLQRQKTDPEIISNASNDLQLLKDNNKQVNYPKKRFYEEEILDIDKEDIDTINLQKEKIRKCGYNLSVDLIESLISQITAMEYCKKLEEILKLGNDLGDDLKTTLENQYYSIDKLNSIITARTEITVEIDKLKNAKKIMDIDIQRTSKHCPEMMFFYGKTKAEVSDLAVQSEKLQEEINDRENGNAIITALSNLFTEREAFILYKNEGYKNCPLCGADETFKNIAKSEELAIDARTYLDKSDSQLVLLREEMKRLNSEMDLKFGELKQRIDKVLDGKKEELEKQNEIFNRYNERTKAFFDGIQEIKINISEDIIEKLVDEKNQTEQKLQSFGGFNEERDLLNNILTLAKYNFDQDDATVGNLKKIQLDLQQLSDESFVVNHAFSFEDYNKKLLFLDNMITNQNIINLQHQIKEYESKNKNLDEKIDQYKKASDKARDLSAKIDKIKKDIEKLEVESVGPYLYNVYSKIIKHSLFEEFKLSRDDARNEGGVTIKDNNGNNLMNILSQGQLGVLMVSYFFANAFRRRQETEFRTYFVDDITNCLDDMNILSFCDLIKYQLYETGGVMDQFFFLTCNDDLEKLFIHKMKSFDIECRAIRFESYAKISQ